MKRNIFSLVVASGLFWASGLTAQWLQEDSPVSENLNAIYFTDVNSGWTVGDNGTILRYASGAWKIFNSPTRDHLYSVRMLSEKEGWIVGENGTILRYDGFLWGPVESPTGKDLYSVSFNEAGEGMAVGAMGVVLQYDHQRWKLVSEDYRFDLHTVAYNNRNVWMGGDLEGIKVPIMRLETSDEVEPTEVFGVNFTVRSLSMPDAFNGWAVGSRNVLLRFNGSYWEKVNISEPFAAQRYVYFTDGSRGISAGYSGTVLLYSEGRWRKEEPVTENKLNAAFIIGNSYYAAGNKGTIIVKKSSPGEEPGNKAGISPAGFAVYPNPGDQFIYLYLPDKRKADRIQAIIRDINGKTVKSIMLDDAEEDFRIMPTEDLLNGVYLITIDDGNKTESSRLVIQHER